MRLKLPQVILILIIILGAFFAIDTLVRKTREEQKRVEPSLVYSLIENDIAKILLKNAGVSTSFTKQGDVWMINNDPILVVDDKFAPGMISAIVEFRRGQVVSKNRDKHVGYGVDEENGIEVTAFGVDGRELAHFFVGNSAPGVGSTYVRMLGNDEVFVSPRALRVVFDKQVEDLREKTIVSFGRDEVQSITLRNNETTQEVKLEKKDNNWQVQGLDPTQTDVGKIDNLVSTLAQLEASSFADKGTVAASVGLSPAKFIVTVQLLGKTHTVLFGEVGDNGVYVKKEASDIIFLMSESIFETNIKLSLDSLRKQ